MNPKLSIKFIDKEDMIDIVAIERRGNTFIDPDFEVEVPRPWTLSADDIIGIIRQSYSKANSTWDTRTLVVKSGKQIVGAFAYELLPESYEIRYIIVHPEHYQKEILSEIAKYIKTNAENSYKRKKAVLHLVDFDGADAPLSRRLSFLLPFWKEQGYVFKLKPNYFGTTDGWEGTFETEIYGVGKNEDDGKGDDKLDDPVFA